MREILFRGKRIDNGEWVTGYYVQKQDPLLSGVTYHYILSQERDNCECLMSTVSWYKVLPETVGQYTGLTDKNGKKIFEGDIIIIDHTIRTYRWDEIPETYKPRRAYSVQWNEKQDELNYKRNYAVEWKEKEARWILRNGSDQHNLKDTFLYFHNGIIIGNIYDNPELLKGGEG